MCVVIAREYCLHFELSSKRTFKRRHRLAMRERIILHRFAAAHETQMLQPDGDERTDVVY